MIRRQAGVSSTPAERSPYTKALGISTTEPGTTVISRTRWSSSSKNTRISRRASDEPRQKCVPKPNDQAL